MLILTKNRTTWKVVMFVIPTLIPRPHPRGEGLAPFSMHSCLQLIKWCTPAYWEHCVSKAGTTKSSHVAWLYNSNTWSLMDCLPFMKRCHTAMMIKMSTIALQEKAANVINSTTLGPWVAVELEPNVCVVKSKNNTNLKKPCLEWKNYFGPF